MMRGATYCISNVDRLVGQIYNFCIAFLMTYLMNAKLWHWIVIWYLLTSLICFGLYAFDKAAAIAGRRRISEVNLLTLGMFGGWPGAILAQQLLRHKTKKLMFRIVFWLSVIANIVCFYFLFNSFT